MTIIKSKLEPHDPCEGCNGKYLSDCCNAPIVMHDICSDCGEHCDTMCDPCEVKPIIKK